MTTVQRIAAAADALERFEQYIGACERPDRPALTDAAEGAVADLRAWEPRGQDGGGDELPPPVAACIRLYLDLGDVADPGARLPVRLAPYVRDFRDRLDHVPADYRRSLVDYKRARLARCVALRLIACGKAPPAHNLESTLLAPKQPPRRRPYEDSLRQVSELAQEAAGLRERLRATGEVAGESVPPTLPPLHQAILDLLEHATRPLTREQIWGRPGPSNPLTSDERKWVGEIQKQRNSGTYRSISKAVDDLLELRFAAIGFGKGVVIAEDGLAFQDRKSRKVANKQL